MQGKDRLRASGGFEAYGLAATPDAKFQARLLKANRLRRPKTFHDAEDKGAVPLFAADILETQSLKRRPPGSETADVTEPVGAGRLKPASLDWRFSGKARKGRGGAQ